MLSQRALEAFHSVMLRGSVSGAADALNVSQPAVSRLIRDLEHQIGISLFLRMGGRIVPTPEARELSTEIERAFVGLTSIERAAADIRRGLRATMSIAAMPALAQNMLPDALMNLRETGKSIRTELLSMQTHNVIRHVTSRQCQIGFAAPTRQQFEIDLLRSYELPYRCILPNGHPLGERERITLDDLDGIDFVGFNESTATGQMLARAFGRRKTPAAVTVRSHLSPIVAAMVARGMGAGVVDAFTAHQHEKAGGISRPFEFDQCFVFAVLRPIGQKLSVDCEALLETIDQQVQGLMNHA
jgi:DNA-binding transcriptional LysR family regulator